MKRYLKKKLKQKYPHLIAAYHEYRSHSQMRKNELCLTPHGFKFIGPSMMQDGTFEPEETALIADYLQRSDVFVDIGANIGLYTCLARSLGKSTVAVEPLEQNLKYLYANLAANNWKDVEVFPLGVAAQPGTAPLYGGGTAASLLKDWAGNPEFWQRTIALSTLDILLGGRFAGQKMFIKMDVEGYEFPVLQGASKIIARNPSPVWMLEICFNENYLEGINPDFKDIFELFWDNDYSSYVIGQELREVTKADVNRWVTTGIKDICYVNYLFYKA